MADRFDRFTDRARRVFTHAQEEAQRLNHQYIGTEHLLLGVLHEQESLATEVLANLGVNLNKVRSAVESIIGRGDRPSAGEIGLTPRAERAIELAVDEAHRLNHHYIGTEHLLLGLVHEGEGIAAGVLKSLDIDLERVRAETKRLLAKHQPQAGTGSVRLTGPRLRQLQQVVPAACVQRQSGIEVTILSLEIYDDGLLIVCAVRDGRDAAAPGESSFLQSCTFALEISDETGAAYVAGRPLHGVIDGQQRLLCHARPAPSPAVRELWLHIPELRYADPSQPGQEAAAPGPWDFTIPLGLGRAAD